MDIRGDRECTECGTHWSYYETGSVDCPACGSIRSTGRGERRLHTDSPATLDLTPVRRDIDDAPIDELLERAADTCRTYVRRRGFVSGGSLQALDDAYVGALELRYGAHLATPKRTLTEDEHLYLLALLRSVDDGSRPPSADVPRSLAAARGLAVARAVRDYRRDLREWIDGRDVDDDVRTFLGLLGDHVTRFEQLDGDVEPETAETLLVATRTLSSVLRGEDESLAAVETHLDRLQ